jgi:RluA family pseudouridine synthase
LVTPLPGSVSHDNFRPIRIPGRFDRHLLFDCLCALHPHIAPDQWRQWFLSGHILCGQQPMPMSRLVRGGEQYLHRFPNTIEPDVDARIAILYEDDWLIAMAKPAPLPVHPCGRYNLNTLTSLLASVYPPADLRLVHRLDANTSGVILLARTAAAATALRQQFEGNTVRKRYLVGCWGNPDHEAFVCEQCIGRVRGWAGSRQVDAAGQPARTEFRRLGAWADGGSLVEAYPRTGRTNQIRIHLWSLGMPVIGDPAYLPGRQLAPFQTLTIDEPPMRLHASRLWLLHPSSGDPIELAAPDPDWLAGLV